MSKIMQHTIIVGLALFAIFFGAGNLIFPPSIGNSAGVSWISALMGFSLTGVILPVLAVYAIYNTGGTVEALTRPIGNWFYKAFNTVMMVCIGMVVTIPRMSATTHELGVSQIIPTIPLLVSVLAFFAICFYFAMDQSNVIDKIGKWLTPVLVIILIILIGKGVLDPIGAAVHTEAKNVFANAIIAAYQTGDVGTGILCAPIFLAAIVSYGYKGKQSKKVALGGMVIAAIGLIAVYGGLLYLGATSSGIITNPGSDTELLASIAYRVIGNLGKALLAICVVFACLTSAIGVMVISSQFLNELTKEKLGYKTWVLIMCIVGATIGSLGVGAIVEITLPIFLVIYPVIIVLVLLGAFDRLVPNAGAYKGTVLFAFLVSVVETISSYGITIPGVTKLILHLPLQSSGFAWAVPSIIGFILGAFLHRVLKAENPEKSTFGMEEIGVEK
ncbi:MAG: branched-chain amino acid transport system II carrier protein [Lysinibacillus fusiformis]|uniref:branched-chain amino acid transport system II carrier protein n=2 Tax=Lysinibacillus fusiformis TaxID=28031 RepID=UPI001245FAFE|nr:branched-chain amino acid transport system II carrier protein [Lysinibacillus fusiformis]KAB0440846.1 branched-chain amino acid transport system II carrier protein [Lysinibacillus fusiformis]MCT6816488.1 branched-chain amino acid transport system II carrier protein [Lysinibacillus fusiformis]MCT6930665.1 branched-chain amino acid transport system II carrier protein [Lysinibacillus fusiformis]MCT6935040.1 branched-chain amino acid transport system II carrier protein [Lysinibacillus fusiformis